MISAAEMAASRVSPPSKRDFVASITDSPVVPGRFLKTSRFFALSKASEIPPMPPRSVDLKLSRLIPVLKIDLSAKLEIPAFN